MTQTTPTKKESKAYILRSPYHSNKQYAKDELQSTTSVSFKRPIDVSIVDKMSKKSDFNTMNAMKSLNHLPPKYKVSGLRIAENAKDACKIYQMLSPKANKKINYSEALRELEDLPSPKKRKIKRERTQIHSSFDLDGDGVVGVKEFAISSFYDVDGDGKLNEAERQNAMNAIRDGIDKKYRFSAEGIHKFTANELAAMNGGWFKHTDIKQREHTLSKLKIKRKQKQKAAATQIAQKCLINKQNNRIPIEFPYKFAAKESAKEENEQKIEKKVNSNKSRSQLIERRRQSHMDGLEQSRFECEKYFKPVAFRKLDGLEESLRKRLLHKSTKTMDDIVEERHAQNKKVGKYWESRTNFDIFNAVKMEREFWKNGRKNAENLQKKSIHEVSNEIYNFSKKRSVKRLPAPFECESDSFKVRKLRFLAKPIEKEVNCANEHLNFKQFSDEIGDCPDNLCVLYGGKSITQNDEGVSSWFKQKKSAMHDTAKMFSSFTSDGIFKEPIYSTTAKQKTKKNLFKTATIQRPQTALNANINFTNHPSKNEMIYRYQSTKKKKRQVRTSGFCNSSASNSSNFERLRVTL